MHILYKYSTAITVSFVSPSDHNDTTPPTSTPLLELIIVVLSMEDSVELGSGSTCASITRLASLRASRGYVKNISNLSFPAKESLFN
jgi:hypothetical protein